ncbi:transposase [Brucella pseudogrignonensis]|uniref:IS110 family transposase n=1 Tax=Brucella pseudogrignonensis TaxID=419475 RepID=UPI0038B64788
MVSGQLLLREGSMRSTNTNDIFFGIDTYKATHVAVVIDGHGIKMATLSIPANAKGYHELERWSRGFGTVIAFGIEGTGSYGAGLSRSHRDHGYKVVEVARPHRQLR